MNDDRRHWLLRDPELLERITRVAARYVPEFRPGEIRAHNSDPEFNQLNFAFGNPGTETGHSLDANNTDRTVNMDGVADYPFFLRWEIEQTLNNADQNLTTTFKLQYRKNGGSFVDVTASSSNVQVLADSDIADGAATTDRISGSAMTFLAGEYDEGDGTFDSITWDPATNNQEHTELLSSLQVIDADMAAGDTLDFRIVESDDTLLDVYGIADATLNWEAGDVDGNLDATLPTMTLTGAGEVEVDGTLDATMPVMTLTGLGGVAIVGVLVATLPTMTLTGSGTVTDPVIDGNLDATLPVMTLTGVGEVEVDGVLDTSLPVLLLTGVGEVEIDGSLDATLPTMTLGGVGSAAFITLFNSSNIAVGGEVTTAQLTAPGGESFKAGRIEDDQNPAASVTAAADEYSEFEFAIRMGVVADTYKFRLTLSGTPVALTVTPKITVSSGTDGNLDATLPTMTLTGAGEVEIDGTLDEVLPTLTLTGAGEVEVDGVLDADLPLLTLTGEGTTDPLGVLDADLPLLTLTGVGEVEVDGVLDADLPLLTVTGVGEVEVDGVLDATLPVLALTGVGEVEIDGTLDATLPTLTLDGTGIVGDVPIDGTLDAVLPTMLLTGSGEVEVDGSLDAVLPTLTLTGTGEVEIDGNLDTTLPLLTVSATGTVTDAPIDGTLDATLPVMTLVGVGQVEVDGTLDAGLPTLVLTGVGEVEIDGTLDAALPLITLDGTGVVGGLPGLAGPGQTVDAPRRAASADAPPRTASVDAPERVASVDSSQTIEVFERPRTGDPDPFDSGFGSGFGK